MTTVYLNGKFCPLSQAKVSVMDRGFLFGDGIYEVIPAYNGQLFRFSQHFARMQNSLAETRLHIDLSEAQLQTVLTQLIEQNEGNDQSLYLQITRGAAPSRQHAFPKETQPTLFICSQPLTPPSYESLKKGIRAITLPDTRWMHCSIKAITLLPNVLHQQLALDSNADDAIFVDNGNALEGTSSNLFVVKNNVLITPPLGSHILGGITRDLIVELAQANGIPVEERMIPLEELRQADEIWLSSSNKEIRPVLFLDDNPISSQPGALWEKMIRLFQAYKQQYTHENA